MSFLKKKNAQLQASFPGLYKKKSLVQAKPTSSPDSFTRELVDQNAFLSFSNLLVKRLAKSLVNVLASLASDEHVHQWLCQHAHHWLDQLCSLVNYKRKKEGNIFWPTSFLVKMTGENVSLVPGILHLIQGNSLSTYNCAFSWIMC